MSKAPNLQDTFLARVKKERLSVTVFLVNGYQLRGKVAGFDPFVVVLMIDGHQNLVYKHAISTLIPQHRIDLHIPREERAAE